MLASIISADISAFIKGKSSADLEDDRPTLWDLSPNYTIINEFPAETFQMVSVWHGISNTREQARQSNAHDLDENCAYRKEPRS
jgi:hypothetical protein